MTETGGRTSISNGEPIGVMLMMSLHSRHEGVAKVRIDLGYPPGHSTSDRVLAQVILHGLPWSAYPCHPTASERCQAGTIGANTLNLDKWIAQSTGPP